MTDMYAAAAMDRGNLNGVIMLDFQMAFDMISHECLLSRGWKSTSVMTTVPSARFRSYLTGRPQQTSVKGHLSETAVITAGIPQGAIIGPLLFISQYT